MTVASPSDPLSGARILFLVDELSAITDGGTERQILQMVDICNQSGMCPHICVFRHTRWLTPRIAGCPVTHFQIEKLSTLRGLRSLISLARWVSIHKFDILQSFFPEANLLGPCIARVAGIPIVLGTRRNLNHAYANGANRVLLRLQRMVNSLVNLTIANSQAVLERIVDTELIPRQRISVVYNGIDLTQMRPAPELRSPMRRMLGIGDGEILVGNISGLREIKGVQMFVDAAAQAHRRDSRLRFILVGDGEMRPQLERAICRHGLEQIIRLNGPAEDVRPYLAALDVAVLCSHAEGFSNSLLEYMACGVPAIATDVGGNREALGSCGLLIRPDVHDLARAIHRMADPRVRKSFAANGLIRVKQFDLVVAQKRMADSYANCLGSVAPRKRGIAQMITNMLARPLNSEGS